MLRALRLTSDNSLKASFNKLVISASAVRASYYSLLNASPGQLIFGQDMITDSFIMQLELPPKCVLMQSSLTMPAEQQTTRCVFYNPGDHVMLRIPKQLRAKTDAVVKGPFLVRVVHDNGTVTIDKGKRPDA
ncbi:unnamed protein product [Peronospora belbahrii]|uniref:Uncharacterized protein n=1 Tax=Peronospora belbahrii TaxID=622444 RepID=A0AAU9L8L6_9STRA|nr:unnamed protein product [Peronospora belbahrii]CAH0480965.1 unnamed protein product [Peronospora belbahrii]CAH0480966.1 unnamed protein product [Peronospora belbahrii]CAH0480967.1 unnamed protein product [Peronospora belbahrii]CAH0480968.1 unnamed protein product [Peronospora belbahrii]